MKVAFIGGGNMASAIIGGLLAQGWQPADFIVVDPGDAQRAQVGVQVESLATLALEADRARLHRAVDRVQPAADLLRDLAAEG